MARLLATLPAAERAKIPDVAQTAIALAEKVEQLAMALSATDAALDEQSLADVDEEIERLEAPPTRSRRARTRACAGWPRCAVRAAPRSSCRASADALRSRLDSCTLALENIRLDLVRLRTGGSTVQSVTLVAEQAMALARDVDRAVEAAQEVRELTSARGVGAGR